MLHLTRTAVFVRALGAIIYLVGLGAGWYPVIYFARGCVLMKSKSHLTWSLNALQASAGPSHLTSSGKGICLKSTVILLFRPSPYAFCERLVTTLSSQSGRSFIIRVW
jgi:hypothetical protein